MNLFRRHIGVSSELKYFEKSEIPKIMSGQIFAALLWPRARSEIYATSSIVSDLIGRNFAKGARVVIFCRECFGGKL